MTSHKKDKKRIFEDDPNENLTCLDCDVKFKSIIAKKYHETSKSKNKRVSEYCEHCEFRSCTKTGLTRHAREVHIEKFKLKCSGCGMKFLEDKHLRIHLYQCKGNKDCKEMDEEIDSFGDNYLKQNVCKSDEDPTENSGLSVSEDIKSNLKCFQCDATFARIDAKRHHEANISKNCRFHDCPFCSKKFCTKLSQRSHLRRNHSDLHKFNCLYCKSKFLSAKSLQNHKQKNMCKLVVPMKTRQEILDLAIKSSKLKQSLSCYKCDAKFTYDIERKKHEEKSDSLFGKTFNCEYCREKFCTKASLGQHKRERHHDQCKDNKECNETEETDLFGDNYLKQNVSKDEEVINASKDNPLAYKAKDFEFDCYKCDATFITFESKRYHEDKERKGTFYHCTSGHCSFKSCTKMQLILHSRKCHKDTFNFECYICKDKFPSKYDLKRHLNRKHDRDKESYSGITEEGKGKQAFKCCRCDATFTRKWYKRDHETKFCQDLYRCHICSEKFCTPLSRGKHIRRNHPDQIKFKCPSCKKKFFSADSLSNHMLMYHHNDIERKTHEEKSGTFEKTFNCEYCIEKFCTKSSLRRHSGERHADQLKFSNDSFKCSRCDCTFTLKFSKGRHEAMFSGQLHSCKLCLFKSCNERGVKVHMRQEHINPGNNLIEEQKIHKTQKTYYVLPRPKKGKWIVPLQKIENILI